MNEQLKDTVFSNLLTDDNYLRNHFLSNVLGDYEQQFHLANQVRSDMVGVIYAVLAISSWNHRISLMTRHHQLTSTIENDLLSNPYGKRQALGLVELGWPEIKPGNIHSMQMNWLRVNGYVAINDLVWDIWLGTFLGLPVPTEIINLLHQASIQKLDPEQDGFNSLSDSLAHATMGLAERESEEIATHEEIAWMDEVERRVRVYRETIFVRAKSL